MKPGMTNEEIKQKLKELILANSYYKGELTENQDLFSDLDYESLSFSALLIELEDEFSISISKEDVLNGINTPQKIFDLIQRKRIDV